MGLFAISLVILRLFTPFDLPSLLGLLVYSLLPPFLAIALLAGIVAGLVKRSFKAGIFVLLSVFLGIPMGRVVLQAAAIVFLLPLSLLLPPLVLQSGLQFAIQVLIGFAGVIVGAIWGAIEGLALYSFDRRRR